MLMRFKNSEKKFIELNILEETRWKVINKK